MSKPRYRWWGFARNMIRDYDKLKVAQKDICQLSPDDQKDYNAVSKAIEITLLQKNGQEHIALIKMMYWNQAPLTAKEAAIHLYVSEITAKRWHGDFVKLVGKYRGFYADDRTAKTGMIIAE